MAKVVLFLLLAGFFPFFCVAQGNDVKINGKVLDEQTQAPVVGASISLAGAKITGTVSDSDGNFPLHVKALPATISVDYLNYKKQEIDIYEYTEPIAVKV